jgi:DNA topoisomerase-1
MAEPYTRWWSRTGEKASGFAYCDSRGRPITAPASLKRIQSLGIPPAWTDVRISPSASTKLQAYGFDRKGRKQYRYHPGWTQQRAAAKFQRLADFARRLPHFRAVTSHHLSQPDLTREKVLALVARLISEGCFRVGGDRYARENHSYGITTLCRHHLEISEACLTFDYRGKHGITQNQVVCDRELASLMRELAALPGPRLFKLPCGDGTHAPLSSRDVNAYVKAIMGSDFSAKDFRTWNGTLLAARVLARYGPAPTEKEAKRNLVRCAREVARTLGNTPAIARSSYIAPVVFDCYMRGITLPSLAPKPRQRLTLLRQGYALEEVELMRMLSIEPEAEEALNITMFPEPLPERNQA